MCIYVYLHIDILIDLMFSMVPCLSVSSVADVRSCTKGKEVGFLDSTETS